MTNQTEKQTHELTSADLEHVVGAGQASTLATFSIAKPVDPTLGDDLIATYDLKAAKK